MLKYKQNKSMCQSKITFLVVCLIICVMCYGDSCIALTAEKNVELTSNKGHRANVQQRKRANNRTRVRRENTIDKLKVRSTQTDNQKLKTKLNSALLAHYKDQTTELDVGHSKSNLNSVKGKFDTNNIVKFKKSKVPPICYPYVSPYLPVRAALLYNMTTGQILYQHNAKLQIPPASLTKVMTLFLTFDAIKQGRLSLKRIVKISRQAARTGGSSMHLRFGERVSLLKLVIGTAVASGNDAAVAVAQTVNPNLSKFVESMNRKARTLGMQQTRFCNPTGLPAYGQVTSVNDMLKLALAYLTRHPQVLRYHNVATFTHGGRLLSTTNPLLGCVCGVNGLKTGWTAASGYNIIVTAQRGQTKLLLVVMGGRSRVSRDMTARKLLEAGFKNPSSAKNVRSAFLQNTNRGHKHKKRARTS